MTADGGANVLDTSIIKNDPPGMPSRPSARPRTLPHTCGRTNGSKADEARRSGRGEGHQAPPPPPPPPQQQHDHLSGSRSVNLAASAVGPPGSAAVAPPRRPSRRDEGPLQKIPCIDSEFYHFRRGNDLEESWHGRHHVVLEIESPSGSDLSTEGEETEETERGGEAFGRHRGAVLPPPGSPHYKKLRAKAILIIVTALVLATLFVAYVCSGLVLLFHLGNGGPDMSKCLRPFWLYAYYGLSSPLLLAIVGLTNRSKWIRGIYVLMPSIGFFWFIVFYTGGGSASDPLSCNHEVSQSATTFYHWVLASFMVQAGLLMAAAWMLMAGARSDKTGQGEEWEEEEDGGKKRRRGKEDKRSGATESTTRMSSSSRSSAALAVSPSSTLPVSYATPRVPPPPSRSSSGRGEKKSEEGP